MLLLLDQHLNYTNVVFLKRWLLACDSISTLYLTITQGDCGITNQKITIKYENQVPCDKPIITYISPMFLVYKH